MEFVTTVLPRELHQSILLYLNHQSLNRILSLPEFTQIPDNLFWYQKIEYEFPIYYVPKLYYQNWKEIYRGLYFLEHPIDFIERINRTGDYDRNVDAVIRHTPNTFSSFLNSGPKDRKFGPIFPVHVRNTIWIIMSVVRKDYPETFKYLIKNDLIRGTNNNLDRMIKTWIAHFNDPELILHLSSRYPDIKTLLQDLLKTAIIRTDTLKSLIELAYPNTTTDDYLEVLSHVTVPITADQIIGFIESVDKYKLFNYFQRLIMNNIAPVNLIYIWNKYRSLFDQIDISRLRRLAEENNYLVHYSNLGSFGVYDLFT